MNRTEGVRVGTAECEFRAALFAYLPGKLTCPVAFALDEHGRTMVEQPIQRCRCCRRVTEDRSPFSWHFITGHNDAFLFVACRYQLKKQLSLQRCERTFPPCIFLPFLPSAERAACLYAGAETDLHKAGSRRTASGKY